MSNKRRLTRTQERRRIEGLRLLARIIARHYLAHPELYPSPGEDGPAPGVNGQVHGGGTAPGVNGQVHGGGTAPGVNGQVHGGGKAAGRDGDHGP